MDVLNRIQSIIGESPDNFGISICLSDGTEVFSHNPDELFSSASVIKLFVLSYYLDSGFPLEQKITFGSETNVSDSIITELSLKELTVKELLTLMIASSDNTATNILISVIGGTGSVTNYIQKKLGLKNTVMQRYMLDFESRSKGLDNFTSANDTVFILKHLQKFPVAGEILSAQKDRSGLMRYIFNNNTLFYGKSGELENVRNDSGILKMGDREAVSAIFTRNVQKSRAEMLCGLCGLAACARQDIIF